MYNRKFNTDAILGKILENEKRKTYNNDDENLYKPNAKLNGGNYSAIIRFMPPPIDEELPFVKRYSHGWEDVRGWYIQNCPSTIGQDCPVCRENGRIWTTDESTARPRSRKTSFYTNVLIVKDKQHPELEGKILKFRYGVKIHEKIMAKLNPEDEDFEQKVFVFDYENGANFKLIIKTVESGGKKFLNYDSSEFATPGPIGMGKEPFTSEELEEVDKQLFSLKEIVAPEQFKTYDYLANEFIKRTGIVIDTDPDAVAQPKPSVPQTKVTTDESAINDDINFDDSKTDIDLSSDTSSVETNAGADYFDDL